MPHSLICVGLGFGDEGKGTSVDYLVRQSKSDLVVRYNGGPQAAHNVVLPNNKRYTFSQFGSGSAVPGCRTLLSRFMLVNPLLVTAEAWRHCGGTQDGPIDSDPFQAMLGSLYIDENAVVITPYHRAANRIAELSRGGYRLGSCGMGIGETMQHWLNYPGEEIRVRDLRNTDLLKAKLYSLKRRLGAKYISQPFNFDEAHPERNYEMGTFFYPIESLLREYDKFNSSGVKVITASEALDLLQTANTPVFEGAQGIGLDQKYGFAPHTTWSDTTSTNAVTLADEAGLTSTVLGITRTYTTRHGYGPLVGENDIHFPMDRENVSNAWQGHWRRAPLDMELLKYAMKVDGNIEGLILTHMDFVQNIGKRKDPWTVTEGYALDGKAYTLPVPKIDPESYIGDTTYTVGQQVTAIHKELSCSEVEDYIASELNSDIVIRSTGPTHQDKVTLKPLQ